MSEFTQVMLFFALCIFSFIGLSLTLVFKEEISSLIFKNFISNSKSKHW